MRNRVVLIRPFFQGTMLNYFSLFLKSCAANPEFDWMVFTDNEEPFDYPPNVHKIKMTFEEAKELVQSKFDFPVEIPRPYKLCDYKAAFGYIFEDYIREYDFWGHNDYDVIYGDLSRFVTDEMLDSYDKLFTLGHFTLYRNTPEITTLFMKDYQGISLYKNAMTSLENQNFDEDWNGILNVNDIFRDQGKRVYENPKNESRIADIYDKSTNFKVEFWDRLDHHNYVEKKRDAVFAYAGGRLLRYERRGAAFGVREYMYIHLKHRRMRLAEGVEDARNFTIIPDVFEPLEEKITADNFDSIRKKEWNLNYFRLRWSNLKIKLKRRLSN